jgi:uncharacterized phage protein gp47/JayE
MFTDIDRVFRECTKIVDKIKPIFGNKIQEYQQVERLVKCAIVRSQVTGKSPSIGDGVQQFLDALIASSRLEEETSRICNEIDRTALCLAKGSLSLGAAYVQLSELKSRLQKTYSSSLLVAQEMQFSKQRIRHKIRL